MKQSSVLVDTCDLYRPNHPFFIIGSGRSGSTLLGSILNNHPRLAVPGESHLFDVFYHLSKYYGDLEKRTNQERLVDDILSTFAVRTWRPPLVRANVLSEIEVPTFAGIANAVMRSWAQDQGKPRWGEKTPHHIFYWSEILECFPDAKLIHLVRDGRDVADSYINTPRFGPKTTYIAARQWVNWLRQIEELKQIVDPSQFLEVRYEDILSEPEFELKKICEYLGESFSSKMLEFHKMGLSDNVTDDSNRRNLRSPVLSNNAQKWRKKYSKSRLRVFESVAQSMLIQHNYETVFDLRPKLPFYEKLYRHAIEHPVYRWPPMITNRIGYIDAWFLLKIRLRLRLIDYFRRE